MKKLFFKIFVIVVTIISLTITSCEKDEDSTEFIPGGKIEGQVFAENGVTPIALANVFIDNDGDIYLTQTDSEGLFSLIAPVGEHVLHIQSGDGTIFRTHLDVVVEKNVVSELPEAKLRLSQVANLAYIKGAYDEIEEVIVNGLGYEATEITVDDLNNLEVMENYAAIFVNCGNHSGLDESKWNNLEQYVENGGNLYISDWAVNFLIGYDENKDVLIDRRSSKPFMSMKEDCLNRVGGFISTDQLCTQRSGLATTIVDADIVNDDLALWLNKDQVDIEFDLGAWEVVKVMGSMWEVLVEDNTETDFGPLAIRTSYNSTGNASNKSGGHQEWITICFYPPGNPENSQTLTIPISAWPAHEALGATLGPCEGGGGTILYTAFHNHHGEEICEDIEKILEYFIINL